MKIAIYGYGNLGRGVECAVNAANDTELFGVFTRRAPDSVKTVSGAKVYAADDILKYKDDIDKTLGSLERFITNYSNESLFQSNFGNSRKNVMRYLKAQISDWRVRYRNGYFHKHNLKQKDRIEAIREETYFLYLLILGAIRLTPGQIMRLS